MRKLAFLALLGLNILCTYAQEKQTYKPCFDVGAVYVHYVLKTYPDYASREKLSEPNLAYFVNAGLTKKTHAFSVGIQFQQKNFTFDRFGIQPNFPSKGTIRALEVLVPVTYKKRVYEKNKLQIHAHTGLVANMLNKAVFKYIQLDDNTNDTLKGTSIYRPIKEKLGVQFRVGTSFEYSINHTLAVGINPYIDYTLKRNDNGIPLMLNPSKFLYAIKLELLYTFK